MYGRGVCRAGEVLARAEEVGLVQRSGSWYSMGDERLGQGREAVRHQLLTDDDLFRRLVEQIRASESDTAAAA